MATLLLCFFWAALLLGVSMAVVIRKAMDIYAPPTPIGQVAEAPKRLGRPHAKGAEEEINPWESTLINPATGLPMIGSHDVGGNTFGTMDSFFR